MASDNHANYGRIGFTVFLGAFALAIALIRLAGVGARDRVIMVETYYDNPVSGLSVGSAVNFRGVKIGEVREIDFVGAIYDDEDMTTNDMQRVIITMALDCKRLDINLSEAETILQKFIDAGIRATISSNPVTGMSRVEFNIPPTPLPIAEIKWKPRYILVPPQPSLMESLSTSMTRALNAFNRIDINGVWSNISVIAESSANLTKDVSDLVRDERANLSEIFRNVESASSSVDDLARTLKSNPSLLLRENDPERLPETK